jgi:hypothetical protein
VDASAGKVLELVVFKVHEEVSRDQFLATNEPAVGWISKQPGFLAHELLYDAEGDRWIELVWWKTMDDAHAAAELALSSESCAPMFALIDMETTLMVHAEEAIAPVHAAAAP